MQQNINTKAKITTAIGIRILRYHSLKVLQVIGRRKYRHRNSVPELTSENDEGMKILVDSCIRGLDRIGVSKRGKSSLARPGEVGEACSKQVPKSSEHENSGKR